MFDKNQVKLYTIDSQEKLKMFKIYLQEGKNDRAEKENAP